MFNAPLLGNGRCHGNRIMADTSGTGWDATTQVSSYSVHCLASYGISNISNMAAGRHFEFKKKLVRGRSRLMKMAPFDRLYATFYWSAIVNISCTISELFDVE